MLHLTNVDVGDGWLIFGLPPAEVAVHPSDEDNVHEFYLMSDDIKAFVAQMAKERIDCGPVQDMGWGLLTQLTLPSGGTLGVYEPRHARPKPMSVKKSMKGATKRPIARKTSSKKPGRRQK